MYLRFSVGIRICYRIKTFCGSTKNQDGNKTKNSHSQEQWQMVHCVTHLTVKTSKNFIRQDLVTTQEKRKGLKLKYGSDFISTYTSLISVLFDGYQSLIFMIKSR
jgi:hypothetical protein